MYKGELNPELGSLTANLRAIERCDREEKIKKCTTLNKRKIKLHNIKYIPINKI